MTGDIALEQVIEGLTSLFEDAKKEMEIDCVIDDNFRPRTFFKSEVLVTLLGRLEDLLDIRISESCYPFYDKDKQEILSLREVAQILIKESTNDK